MSVFIHSILHVLLSLLSIISLAVYINRRKGFLIKVKGSIGVGVQSLFFGLFTAVLGCLFSFFLLASLLVYFHQARGGLLLSSVTSENLIAFFLASIWSMLFAVFGALCIIDGLSTMEDTKPKILTQKTDFEKALKKYPEDLFHRYVEQYPHNPEGVLEWHIHKKMREGKTREQTIEELTKD